MELNGTLEHWHQLTSFNPYRHRYEPSMAAMALHQDMKHEYVDRKSHAVGNNPLKSTHSLSLTLTFFLSLSLSLSLSLLTLFFTVSLLHSRTQNKDCISLIAAFLQLTPRLWHSTQGAALQMQRLPWKC